MKSSFEYIFGGITKKVFINKYFDKKTLHIKGLQNKFSDIFSIDDFNDILNSNQLLYPKVRVTNHRNSIHKYNLIEDKSLYENNINNLLDKKKVLLALAKGGTLIFDSIQQHSLKLESFIDQLADEMNTKINANFYYTAKNTTGVNIHFDRHDVLAIQVNGCKRWYFKEDKHQLSKSIRNQKVPHVNKHRNGWTSVLLEQGDAFYCPRGTWHFTETEGDNSSHIAIGIYPATLKKWLEIIMSDSKSSELLETYVKYPFESSEQSINKDSVYHFIEILEKECNCAYDPSIKQRAYLELE